MLLAKLECYDVDPHSFSDYFTDRRQTARGSDAPSPEIKLLNDIQCYLSSAFKLLYYADDMQLMHASEPSFHGLSQLRSRVETDPAVMLAWFRHNGLKIIIFHLKLNLSLLALRPIFL